MNNNIINTLKVLADKRMEISLVKIRDSDEKYRQEVEKVIELEKKYESLSLQPEIKEFLDTLLSTRDSLNMEDVSLAYFAGMEDCIMLLRSLDLLQL